MYKVSYRLSQIFEPLAVAAVTLCATPAIPDDTPSVSAKGYIDNTLRKREMDYKQYGPPLGNLPPAQHARAMHIEEDLISSFSTSYASRRHAETAAYAMAYAATTASGKNIPVQLYDTTPFIGTVPIRDTPQQKESSFINQYALSHAIAISTSMNIKPSRTEILPADFEKHRQAWQDSHAVMVQSAGNAGTYCSSRESGPAEQQELSTFQFADSYIRVGSARRDAAGSPVINGSSSCTAADIIALNPYEQGLFYRFRASLQEFQERVKRYADDAYEKKLADSREKSAAMLKSIRNSDDTDGAPMTNISGNSFIAPAIGGYIAAAYESCPRMSEYDLLAIAFTRANPITQSEDNIKPSYKWNGRMMFDDARVGFGFLDSADYMQTVKNACNILNDNPALHTIEKSVKSNAGSLRPFPHAKDIPANSKAYAVDLDQDAFAFRLMLEIKLNQHSRNPFTMRIRSPEGATYDMRPAIPPGDLYGSALAATNAFFANNTKGTWTLIVDKDVNIDNVNLIFSAVEPGGLTEEIVKKYSRHKQALPTPAP